MKRTWATIKEIIGSKKSTGTSFPKRLAVTGLKIFNKKTIVEKFKKSFNEIEPKLASKITHYLSLEEKPATDDKLNEVLKTLKTNKSSGYDEISSDVI